VDKTDIIDSTNCNTKVNESGEKDELKSWQKDIEEEKPSSYNGCISAHGQDTKTLQNNNNEDFLFEKNINHSKKLSDNGDYKEINNQENKSNDVLFENNVYHSKDISNCNDDNEVESVLKHDKPITKPLEKEEKEYEVKERKPQLTNTTTSSENPSALSSTASLDHIQGISSSISPLTQVSSQVQEPQTPNSVVSTVSNKIEVLPVNLSNNASGNLLNSKSLNDFKSRQTSIQTTTTPLLSNHPPTISRMFCPPLLNKTTSTMSSKSHNINPTYYQLNNSIPYKHGIWHNNNMQPVPILKTTSTMSPNNQSLLSSLTNSQRSLENMNSISSNLLQNDYMMNLKYPPQLSIFDYGYHQTPILSEPLQQQQYYFGSSLQQDLIHSPQIHNGCQPKFKGSSLINVMQDNNKTIIPPPPPPLQWPYPLTPTTIMYSMKPIQVKF
jgi:hypothetical protein